MTRNFVRQLYALRTLALFVAILLPLAPAAALAQQAHTRPAKSGADIPQITGAPDSGPLTFSPVVTYSSGSIAPFVSPGSLAAVDVNGDGKPDLIVANTAIYDGSVSSVAVLLGNGDGTFQPAVVNTSVDRVGELNALAVVDVNADGKPDLIVSACCESNGNDEASVLIGNGDGTFLSAVKYDVGGRPSSSLAVQDVNGDGRPDIVSINWNGSNDSTTTVLLGNGDGTFQSPLSSEATIDPSCATIADINQDGKPDLLICSEDTVTVLLGNGNGTFRSFNNNNFYAGFCESAVMVMDVNADGVPDLVVPNATPNGGFGCSSEGLAGVLLGNGDGTFQAEVNYLALSNIHIGVGSGAASDLNNDGKPDVMITSGLGLYGSVHGSVGVLLGNGDGTFQTATTLDTGGPQADAVVAADLNGDAKPDIVVANFGSSTLGVLLNSTVSGTVATSTALASSLNPSNFGESVTFTATVTSSSGTPPGTVAFFDGSTSLGSATLAGGVASMSTAALAAGSHAMKAAYQGSGDFAPSTSPVLAQVVNGGTTNTTTTLVSSVNPSGFGQSVTFTATVTSTSGTPPGTVVFFDGATAIGNANLANGIGSLSTSSLAIGTHSITAAYQGSGGFLPSTSAPLNQVVNGSSTTTALVSSARHQERFRPVTYAATISSQNGGAVTGTVLFQDNGSTLATVTVSGNAAHYTTSYPAAGTHLIVATYSGDANNAGSTSPTLTQFIGAGKPPFPTETALSITGSVLVGQPVKFTATVSSLYGTIPDGDTVKFFVENRTIGTAALAGGVAAVTTSSIPAGRHSIQAFYEGDPNFKHSFVIKKYTEQKYPTTTTLVSSLNPAVYGQPVTYTVTVTSTGPDIPTGNVKLTDIGLLPLVAGVATITKAKVAVGSHAITAEYLADPVSEKSTSPVLHQVVTPASTTTTITSSANPSSLGQTVTFTATVTSSTGVAPFGSVTFTAGSLTLGTVAIANGQASISTASLPQGSTTITATYSGAAGFTGSSASLTQTVNP